MPIIRTIATLKPADHANGQATIGGVRPAPTYLSGFTALINCTTNNVATPFTGFAHPFSNPAMSITFGAQSGLTVQI